MRSLPWRHIAHNATLDWFRGLGSAYGFSCSWATLARSPVSRLPPHAPLDELREILATDCPMILFSSTSQLTRSDVLYHPGSVSKFTHNPPFTCNDEPFRHHSPDYVQQLISSSVSDHAAGAQACRERLSPRSVKADLHFPLFCTPYYGFVPTSEVDLLVEILQLSTFLYTCCFSREGEGLSQLGDSLPTAAALLSTLASIPNDRSGGSIEVFPGTGVFICDPAPVPQQGEPAIACWLYTPARLPSSPPKAFCTLVSTLSPGDSSVCTPLFETHSPAPGLRTGIPLGSHVCVHLNASRLPTPFLDRSETLTFLLNGVGWAPPNIFTHSPTLVAKNCCYSPSTL